MFFALLLALPPPHQAEVVFQDGSLVKMTLQEKTLDMQTRYGQLSIPLKEIYRISFDRVDSVQTVDGTILGKVTNKAIRSHNIYFGNLTLKCSDLKSIQMRLNSGIEIERVVEAGGNWLDTELQVASGDIFLMTTIGQV